MRAPQLRPPVRQLVRPEKAYARPHVGQAVLLSTPRLRQELHPSQFPAQAHEVARQVAVSVAGAVAATVGCCHHDGRPHDPLLLLRLPTAAGLLLLSKCRRQQQPRTRHPQPRPDTGLWRLLPSKLNQINQSKPRQQQSPPTSTWPSRSSRRRTPVIIASFPVDDTAATASRLAVGRLVTVPPPPPPNANAVTPPPTATTQPVDGGPPPPALLVHRRTGRRRGRHDGPARGGRRTRHVRRLALLKPRPFLCTTDWICFCRMGPPPTRKVTFLSKRAGKK